MMTVPASSVYGVVLLMIVTEASARASSNSTLRACATHVVQRNRQNLTDEIGTAKGDLATALRLSSKFVVNVTLNRTEEHFVQMRDLILDHVTQNMEKCFRPSRYSVVPIANPMCLTRSGVRLQRQINQQTRLLAQALTSMGQRELLELGGGGAQLVIHAVSGAVTKAALPLARNMMACVYGERVASVLKL